MNLVSILSGLGTISSPMSSKCRLWNSQRKVQRHFHPSAAGQRMDSNFNLRSHSNTKFKKIRSTRSTLPMVMRWETFCSGWPSILSATLQPITLPMTFSQNVMRLVSRCRKTWIAAWQLNSSLTLFSSSWDQLTFQMITKMPYRRLKWLSKESSWPRQLETRIRLSRIHALSQLVSERT